MYYKNVRGGYIISYGRGSFGIIITEKEYESIKAAASIALNPPDGFIYKLRADNLEWELVELPPVEPEPPTEEEALTRYANSLTGANDPDLISAAETLITDRIKEEYK